MARGLSPWVAAVESRLKALGKRAHHGPSYVGTTLDFWSVTIPNIRRLVRDLAADLPAPWDDCAQALWERPVYDLRILAILLAAHHHPSYQKKHWTLLTGWLQESEGWAMVDTLCCDALAPMLITYPDLAAKTRSWPRSKNLWVRRASLVIFCVPVGKGQFAEQALDHAAQLLADRDPMIVKAESWILRTALKHFRTDVDAFLTAHESACAPLILREVRTKLTTGRKTNRSSSCQ
jgi:3-methyladenine DNA glycosylase AlkD